MTTSDHDRQLLTNAGISDLEAAQLAPNGPLEFYKTSQEADHAATAMIGALKDVVKARHAVGWTKDNAGHPTAYRSMLEDLHSRLIDDGDAMVRAIAEYREAAALRAEEEEARSNG